MTKFRKGDHVHYALEKLGKGCKVAALVHRVHRDGTVTVKARFLVRAGNREGGYLGYRYRYAASLLKAA